MIKISKTNKTFTVFDNEDKIIFTTTNFEKLIDFLEDFFKIEKDVSGYYLTTKKPEFETDVSEGVIVNSPEGIKVKR